MFLSRDKIQIIFNFWLKFYWEFKIIHDVIIL